MRSFETNLRLQGHLHPKTLQPKPEFVHRDGTVTVDVKVTFKLGPAFVAEFRVVAGHLDKVCRLNVAGTIRVDRLEEVHDCAVGRRGERHACDGSGGINNRTFRERGSPSLVVNLNLVVSISGWGSLKTKGLKGGGRREAGSGRG